MGQLIMVAPFLFERRNNMFFQGLMYIGLIVLAIWAIWYFIIKDIINVPSVKEKLEDMGIEVDETPKLTETFHTKRLIEMKIKLDKMKVSADAATMSAEMSEEMKKLEKEIKKAEKIIEKNEKNI